MNRTNDYKTTTLQAATSLELEVAQEWEKDKHTEIKILIGENPTYKPLCVDLKKLMMGEEKYPNSLTEA